MDRHPTGTAQHLLGLASSGLAALPACPICSFWSCARATSGQTLEVLEPSEDLEHAHALCAVTRVEGEAVEAMLGRLLLALGWLLLNAD